MTLIAFLGFYVMLSVMALVRHPVYGLYLYVAVFYLHPPSRWWGAMLPDVRWSLLAAAITCVAIVFQRRKSHRESRDRLWTKGPALLYLLYVAYMFLQTPWAVDPEQHSLGLSIFTKYLVVIYMIHACLDTRDRLATFLLTHALGCLYLGLVAWTTKGSGRLDGVGGPGIDEANSLAMQLGTGIYAAAAYYFSTKGWRRFIPVSVVPFALNGMVLAGSRGGFLALLCGGLAFFVMRPRDTLRQLAIYGVLGAGLFLYLASDFFLDRLGTIKVAVEEPTEVDHSIASRIFLFGAQWRMAKDHPFGAGHGATTALSYQYIPVEYHASQGGRSSHNTFMSALVDQGFLGLTAWLIIVAMLWRRLRLVRLRRTSTGDVGVAWLSAGTAAMLVTVCTAGLFAPLIRTEVYVWIVGLVCCMDRLAPIEAIAPARQRDAPKLQTALQVDAKQSLRMTPMSK